MANIIFVPFAYKCSANTGVNIRKKKSSLDIYLKNCCVALISARSSNSLDTECALVTNIDIPSPYKELLSNNGILIIKQEFSCFDFPDSYRWALAFYKLCALYEICRKTNYDNYAYIDSDVFVQKSFNDIWEECRHNILMYDLGEDLHSEEYGHFINEVWQTTLVGESFITHYGGEFFAASRERAIAFSRYSKTIFEKMKVNGYTTTHGDEFIISIAAREFESIIRNSEAYVSRLWTGTYRMIPSNYKEVSVLHMPAEKEYGFIRLFKLFVTKGKKLSMRQVYHIVHINHPSLLTMLKKLVKVFVDKNKLS